MSKLHIGGIISPIKHWFSTTFTLTSSTEKKRPVRPRGESKQILTNGIIPNKKTRTRPCRAFKASISLQLPSRLNP
jgi:hypothetical protein